MTFKAPLSWPVREVRSRVTPEQQRRAYLNRAREDGYKDGLSGKLRATASYFTNEDEEALVQYRRGLRVGRRERART